MTKLQKVFLWLGLGLFLIPEILWSPLGNFYYSWLLPAKNGSIQILRHNFLFDPERIIFYSLVLLSQFFGSLLSIILLFKTQNFIKQKVLLFIVMLISFLLVPLSFFALYVTLSLRHVGF